MLPLVFIPGDPGPEQGTALMPTSKTRKLRCNRVAATALDLIMSTRESGSMAGNHRDAYISSRLGLLYTTFLESCV